MGLFSRMGNWFYKKTSPYGGNITKSGSGYHQREMYTPRWQYQTGYLGLKNKMSAVMRAIKRRRR